MTCAFEGCDHQPRSNSEPLCEGHYYQRRRGTPLRPLGKRRSVGEPKVCGLDGCQKPAHEQLCPMHAARVRRHGDPAFVIHQSQRDLPRREASPKWNPEPGYDTTHARIRRYRGPASAQRCACGAPAQQWAYIGPRDPSQELPFGDVDQYEAMCVSCHKRMDLAAIRELRSA